MEIEKWTRKIQEPPLQLTIKTVPTPPSDTICQLGCGIDLYSLLHCCKLAVCTSRNSDIIVINIKMENMTTPS